MHSPANKVAYDVGMADNDLCGVTLLRGWGTVKIFPKGSLNPWAMDKIHLGREEKEPREGAEGEGERERLTDESGWLGS